MIWTQKVMIFHVILVKKGGASVGVAWVDINGNHISTQKCSLPL